MNIRPAHWIIKTHLFRADEYICYLCRASYKKPYKNCPNCGAYMGKTIYSPTWVDETEGLAVLMDEDW